MMMVKYNDLARRDMSRSDWLHKTIWRKVYPSVFKNKTGREILQLKQLKNSSCPEIYIK